MTIKELIEELQEFNDDTDEDVKVAFRDGEGFYQNEAFIGWNVLTANKLNGSDRDKSFDDCIVISLY